MHIDLKLKKNPFENCMLKKLQKNLGKLLVDFYSYCKSLNFKIANYLMNEIRKNRSLCMCKGTRTYRHTQ